MCVLLAFPPGGWGVETLTIKRWLRVTWHRGQTPELISGQGNTTFPTLPAEMPSNQRGYMSKADKIRYLYGLGWADGEIANEIGCGKPYVRVVARQRVNGISRHDIAYVAKNRNKLLAYYKRYYRARKASQEART